MPNPRKGKVFPPPIETHKILPSPLVEELHYFVLNLLYLAYKQKKLFPQVAFKYQLAVSCRTVLVWLQTGSPVPAET